MKSKKKWPEADCVSNVSLDSRPSADFAIRKKIQKTERSTAKHKALGDGCGLRFDLAIGTMPIHPRVCRRTA